MCRPVATNQLARANGFPLRQRDQRFTCEGFERGLVETGCDFRMSEIKFIVEHLNQKPFNRDLTLVSFDELSPFELLQLLNDVLEYLDPQLHKVDLREESQAKEGATANRMMDFLRILKFKVPQNNAERFKIALGNGDRSAVYHVLHYLLSRLEPLKTRAYLARFLVNVEIPSAFLHDEAIQDVYQHYKQLQREFKETHKAVESLRHNTMQPGELKREIAQLEEEKGQLIEKINNLKRKTEDMPGFKELYDVTSALRREQEDETKLLDQGREQQASLEMCQRKLEELRRRYEELSASQRDDDPDELLSRMEREVQEQHDLLEEKIPGELQEAYDRLGDVERGLSEPIKTQSDVDEVEARVLKTRREIDSLQEQVDRSRRLSGSDDKLKMFRQQGAMIQKKLQQKTRELEEVLDDVQRLDKELADKERALAGMAGSQSMRKSDFRQYASELRQKTQEYKRKKQELSALRAETVILARTETILRSRGENVEEFLKALERGKGVEGAAQMEQELEDVSKKAADLNKNKKMTLEEISEIVRQLKDTLAKRKQKLTPQIEKLRSVREKFKNLEHDYLDKKALYDNTAVGLESERIKLENECNALQGECIREESRFHYLHCLTDIANVQLNRVQDELAFQRGEGRLLRDFKAYKDLYHHKIQQQEQLSKELRKKQRNLKENAPVNTEQRQMFVDLKRLLQLKARVAQQSQRPGFSDNVFDLNNDSGGANIMTIDQ